MATGVYTGAAQAACERGGNVLGVSRTITLDTQGGKLYGGLQYGSSDLLRDGEVVLTFDDGPLRRYTRMVLAALEAELLLGHHQVQVAADLVLRDHARLEHAVHVAVGEVRDRAAGARRRAWSRSPIRRRR